MRKRKIVNNTDTVLFFIYGRIVFHGTANEKAAQSDNLSTCPLSGSRVAYFLKAKP